MLGVERKSISGRLGGYPVHAASSVRAPTMAAGASSCSGGCRGPFEGEVAHPGEGVSREIASQETTTPAALAAAARWSGVKSGSGCDVILKIGMPLGVSKLAQFRTLRPRNLPLRHMLPPPNRQSPAARYRAAARPPGCRRYRDRQAVVLAGAVLPHRKTHSTLPSTRGPQTQNTAFPGPCEATVRHSPPG